MEIRQKNIIFTFLTLIIPLLFLFILELILRLAVSSPYKPIVDTVSYDNIEWYQINRSYLVKYFPGGTQLVPEFKPALFRKEKPANLFRIICLGGSSMFGTPYQMTSNIPGIVRTQLRHLFPNREIEVINLAASAINSQVIKRLIHEIYRFEPDLVLLYMGHNEFYGPDGVGATTLEKNVPFILNLKYYLRELRTYQILQSWLTSASPKDPSLEDKNLMREVSRGSQIKLNSADSKRIFSQFSDNLQEIINQMKRNKIPLIVSDVASNLHFVPFSYSPEVGEVRIEEAVIEIENLFDRMEIEETLEQLEDIYRQDEEHALINYWLGKCYLAQNRSDSANKYLSRARDYDLLKFRAPSRINEIIREVCKNNNIPQVSSDSYLSQNSEDGITGYDLFWEHLHPNTSGYFLISQLFLQKILQLDIVENNPSNTLLPLEMDSLNICWLDLGYADISIKNLTGKWPFRNFEVSTVYLDQADPQLSQIASDVYNRKIVWDDGCYRSAAWFEKIDQFNPAKNTYESILEEYPFNFYAHYQLARLYRDYNHFEKAVKHYDFSIRSNPRYLFAHLDLGMIQINQGLFDAAIAHLKTALSLTSDKNNPAIEANITYGLSAAYANKQDLETAIGYVDRALQIIPNYPAAIELKKGLIQAIKRR